MPVYRIQDGRGEQFSIRNMALPVAGDPVLIFYRESDIRALSLQPDHIRFTQKIFKRYHRLLHAIIIQEARIVVELAKSLCSHSCIHRKGSGWVRSEEHTSELQSRGQL